MKTLYQSKSIKILREAETKIKRWCKSSAKRWAFSIIQICAFLHRVSFMRLSYSCNSFFIASHTLLRARRIGILQHHYSKSFLFFISDRPLHCKICFMASGWWSKLQVWRTNWFPFWFLCGERDNQQTCCNQSTDRYKLKIHINRWRIANDKPHVCLINSLLRFHSFRNILLL